MSFLKSLPLLIWDHRGNIFAALLILAGVAIAIGAVLAMIGFAVTVGLPLAAGILIVLVSFFAIAWLPFAVVIFFFGLFSYRRSILTHRTRNALILTCIAIFIGDLFSVELRDSLLFSSGEPSRIGLCWLRCSFGNAVSTFVHAICLSRRRHKVS